MKKFLFITFAAFIFNSCDDNSINGNGNIRTEKRTVDNFEGAKTTGSIDIEVKNGDNRMVEVEADDNVLPYIVTKVENGLLNVYYKPNTSFNNAHAVVYVTSPSFKKLITQGSGDITSKNMVKGPDHMELSISGSGDIKALIDAPSVNADIVGSGNISLEGKTRNFKSDVSGSGDLNCGKLLSENTTVDISGSGNAHVFASVTLKARVSGSGDIYYAGNPPSPEINKSGGGSIQPE